MGTESRNCCRQNMKFTNLLLVPLVNSQETCYSAFDPACQEINCLEDYDWASINCIKTCNWCHLTAPDSQEDAPIFLTPPNVDDLVATVKSIISTVESSSDSVKSIKLTDRIKGRIELKFTRFSSFLNSQIESQNCDSLPSLQNVYRAETIEELCNKLRKKVSKVQCNKGPNQLTNRAQRVCEKTQEQADTDPLAVMRRRADVDSTLAHTDREIF